MSQTQNTKKRKTTSEPAHTKDTEKKETTTMQIYMKQICQEEKGDTLGKRLKSCSQKVRIQQSGPACQYVLDHLKKAALAGKNETTVTWEDLSIPYDSTDVEDHTDPRLHEHFVAIRELLKNQDIQIKATPDETHCITFSF